MLKTSASALVSAAERLRLEEGAHKVAARLVGLAATMLLLEGIKEQDIDRELCSAFKEFRDGELH